MHASWLNLFIDIYFSPTNIESLNAIDEAVKILDSELEERKFNPQRCIYLNSIPFIELLH